MKWINDNNSYELQYSVALRILGRKEADKYRPSSMFTHRSIQVCLLVKNNGGILIETLLPSQKRLPSIDAR